MNRYEKYKDNGIAWLGEVPEHWEVKHSNQIFKIHNGATPKTSEADYWGDEIAWFTPKDLGDNDRKEISQSLKMITELGYQNCGVSLGAIDNSKKEAKDLRYCFHATIPNLCHVPKHAYK